MDTTTSFDDFDDISVGGSKIEVWNLEDIPQELFEEFIGQTEPKRVSDISKKNTPSIVMPPNGCRYRINSLTAYNRTSAESCIERFMDYI